MHVARTFEELAAVTGKAFLAIGVFDGVHLGHQRVIGQAVADARAQRGHAVALTFDPHPRRVLQPDQAPPLLTSTRHKLRLIELLGVHACLVINFDRAFSRLSPEQFIELIAHRVRRLQEICVGARFRFGHLHAGDVRLLEDLGPAHGYVTREIPSVKLDDETISSTAVRQQLLKGRLDRAAAMLGRPFAILGRVERGEGIGQKLGFPTANLDPQGELLPPDGVYVTQAEIDGQTHGGLVNIGHRPTFAAHGHQRACELHVLDFDRDLYQQEIEVRFLRKLRDEQKFDSGDALRRQIAADVQAARGVLSGSHSTHSEKS